MSMRLFILVRNKSSTNCLKNISQQTHNLMAGLKTPGKWGLLGLEELDVLLPPACVPHRNPQDLSLRNIFHDVGMSLLNLCL